MELTGEHGVADGAESIPERVEQGNERHKIGYFVESTVTPFNSFCCGMKDKFNM